MKKRIFCVLFTAVFFVCTSGFTFRSSDITDYIQDVAQSDDENVLMVKMGSPEMYPDKTYEEVFGNFFANPTWKYFVGTEEGPDDDGDGKADYTVENVDVVEFTGYCFYGDVEVKALIQFVLDKENGTFETKYLAFNDVPQNLLTLNALIVKAFESFDVTPETSIINSAEISGHQNTGMIAENRNTSEKYEAIYSDSVQKIKSELEQEGEDWSWLQYALYDMDQDGYLELLIQKGTCNADMAYEVYTTDGQSAIFLGEALGMAQCIYTAPKEQGFYTYFSRQWCDTVSLVSLTNGTLDSEEIYNVENVGWTNSYSELNTQIITRSLGDGMIWEESELLIAPAVNEYIFPNSDKEYLTETEVRSKSSEELLYGRNEIYARHGYIFQTEEIRRHFENTSWYVGTITGDQFDPAVFNGYENANLELILQIEDENAGGKQQQKYNFAGEYIDGTDEDYTRIVITQNGNTVSYDWYSGDVYQFSGYDVPINEDGTVSMRGGGIWLEDDGTLKYSPGVGGTDNFWTFWKVR